MLRTRATFKRIGCAECRIVARDVKLPVGYSLAWSGQYEYMQRAAARMKLVVPATLPTIFMLLYFNFRSVSESLIVMLSVPFALAGGFWFVWVLGLQLVGRGGHRVHSTFRSRH